MTEDSKKGEFGILLKGRSLESVTIVSIENVIEHLLPRGSRERVKVSRHRGEEVRVMDRAAVQEFLQVRNDLAAAINETKDLTKEIHKLEETIAAMDSYCSRLEKTLAALVMYSVLGE